MEPILGFTREAKVFDPSATNPLGALVNRDVPARVRQVRQWEPQAQVQGLKFLPPENLQKLQRKWSVADPGAEPLRP